MKSASPSLDPVAFFKCLSEPTRLSCLLLLQAKKELCVCDLMTALDESQPKVSRHLAELRACGLVKDERRGKWVYYRLDPTLPSWARKILRETTTGIQTELLAPCLNRLQTPALSC